MLAGGRSPEREVSLRSEHRVMTALVSRGYGAFVLDPADSPFVETLSAARVFACYIALHGNEGEDGTVQRLLDLLGISYTGTGPHACQMAFDKILAKETLDAAGIPTPAWAAIEASAIRDLAAGPVLHRVVEQLGLPLVVKPSRAGSAMGLSFVEREQDLPGAVMGALSFSSAAILERKIVGTEVAVAMVEPSFEPSRSSRSSRSPASSTMPRATPREPPSTSRRRAWLQMLRRPAGMKRRAPSKRSACETWAGPM